MRYADNRDLNNAWKSMNAVFNEAGAESKAACLDEVFFPIDDVHEAVFIFESDVARVKPTVTKTTGGCGLVFPVTQRDALPGGCNFPFLSRRTTFAMLVENGNIDPRHWEADRTWFVVNAIGRQGS